MGVIFLFYHSTVRVEKHLHLCNFFSYSTAYAMRNMYLFFRNISFIIDILRAIAYNMRRNINSKFLPERS